MQKIEHLNKREQQAVQAYLTWLRERYDRVIKRIVLFGSQARGDAKRGSDIDLLIVVAGNNRWPYWRDIVGYTSDIQVEYGALIAALVIDEEEFARFRYLRTPLYCNIQKEGIDLWTHGKKSWLPSRLKGFANTSKTRKISPRKSGIVPQ